MKEKKSYKRYMVEVVSVLLEASWKVYLLLCPTPTLWRRAALRILNCPALLSCECLHVEHVLQVTHVTVLEKPWDRRGSASLQQVSQAWLWSEGRVKGCEMGH